MCPTSHQPHSQLCGLSPGCAGSRQSTESHPPAPPGPTRWFSGRPTRTTYVYLKNKHKAYTPVCKATYSQQPKGGSSLRVCPSTDAWIKKHNGIVFSLQKEGHSGTCYNRSLMKLVLSEISQTRKDTHCRLHVEEAPKQADSRGRFRE